jgi:hypothetical protein
MRSTISARTTARAARGAALLAVLALTATGVTATGVTPARAVQARAAGAQAVRAGAGPTRPNATRTASASGWRLSVVRHYGATHDASGYSAVVAPGGSDVWVFGGTNPGGASAPVALHWDGATWRSWKLPSGLTGFISSASAPSGRDIWAVSYAGGYALRWNGKHWSVARRWRHGGALTGVTALSGKDVWVFGTTAAGVHGLGTWHFNGRSWTQVSGLAGQIYRASAVSARDIWAVAATRRGGFVEHYDGHSWRRADIGRGLDRAALDDVLALSRRNVWVVGNLATQHGDGRLVLAHFNGRRWAMTQTPWNADTGRLAADGSGGVWITADNNGSRTDALIGHLCHRCKLTWTTVRHGLGSGISGIAVSRGSGAAWLSGGFLTTAGGDAAIWDRPGARRPRSVAASDRLRPGDPLAYRSARINAARINSARINVAARHHRGR